MGDEIQLFLQFTFNGLASGGLFFIFSMDAYTAIEKAKNQIIFGREIQLYSPSYGRSSEFLKLAVKIFQKRCFWEELRQK